jgi:hypothetical protein
MAVNHDYIDRCKRCGVELNAYTTNHSEHYNNDYFGQPPDTMGLCIICWTETPEYAEYLRQESTKLANAATSAMCNNPNCIGTTETDEEEIMTICNALRIYRSVIDHIPGFSRGEHDDAIIKNRCERIIRKLYESCGWEIDEKDDLGIGL